MKSIAGERRASRAYVEMAEIDCKKQTEKKMWYSNV